MTDKEPIIIDGVNVSGCGYFYIRPNNRAVCCTCHVDCHCAANPNCYFKQLARKTQEYEELKEEYTELKLENKELYRILADLKEVRKLKDSYRKALEEIERELKEDIYCESQECGCDDYEECLRCTKNIILDIISKADFGKSERSETRLGESCVEPVEPPIIQEAKGEE